VACGPYHYLFKRNIQKNEANKMAYYQYSNNNDPSKTNNNNVKFHGTRLVSKSSTSTTTPTPPFSNNNNNKTNNIDQLKFKTAEQVEEERQWKRARGPFENFGAESFTKWENHHNKKETQQTIQDYMDDEDRANISLFASRQSNYYDDNDEQDIGGSRSTNNNKWGNVIPGPIPKELMIARQDSNKLGKQLLTFFARQLRKPLSYSVPRISPSSGENTRHVGLGYRIQQMVEGEHDSRLKNWIRSHNEMNDSFEKETLDTHTTALQQQQGLKAGLSFQEVEVDEEDNNNTITTKPTLAAGGDEGEQSARKRGKAWGELLIATTSSSSTMISSSNTSSSFATHQETLSLVPSSKVYDPFKLIRLRDQWSSRIDMSINPIIHNTMNESFSTTNNTLNNSIQVPSMDRKFTSASSSSSSSSTAPLSLFTNTHQVPKFTHNDDEKDDIGFVRTVQDGKWNPPQLLRVKFGFSDVIQQGTASSSSSIIINSSAPIKGQLDVSQQNNTQSADNIFHTTKNDKNKNEHVIITRQDLQAIFGTGYGKDLTESIIQQEYKELMEEIATSNSSSSANIAISSGFVSKPFYHHHQPTTYPKSLSNSPSWSDNSSTSSSSNRHHHHHHKQKKKHHKHKKKKKKI
jgi:hypothetical protein